MNKKNNIMEYLEDELQTPHFGNNKKNKTVVEESFGKKFRKITSDSIKNFENNEKCKNKKLKKYKTKSKGKTKSKSKEKNDKKFKSSKSKKNKDYSLSLQIEQKYENPLEKKTKNKDYSFSLPIQYKYENPLVIFLQKKLQLRDDFDQNHSEKFLYEKELAFQQFQMNENADYLEN